MICDVSFFFSNCGKAVKLIDWGLKRAWLKIRESFDARLRERWHWVPTFRHRNFGRTQIHTIYTLNIQSSSFPFRRSKKRGRKTFSSTILQLHTIGVFQQKRKKKKSVDLYTSAIVRVFGFLSSFFIPFVQSEGLPSLWFAWASLIWLYEVERRQPLSLAITNNFRTQNKLIRSEYFKYANLTYPTTRMQQPFHVWLGRYAVSRRTRLLWRLIDGTSNFDQDDLVARILFSAWSTVTTVITTQPLIPQTPPHTLCGTRASPHARNDSRGSSGLYRRISVAVWLGLRCHGIHASCYLSEASATIGSNDPATAVAGSNGPEQCAVIASREWILGWFGVSALEPISNENDQ